MNETNKRVLSNYRVAINTACAVLQKHQSHRSAVPRCG